MNEENGKNNDWENELMSLEESVLEEMREETRKRIEQRIQERIQEKEKEMPEVQRLKKNER